MTIIDQRAALLDALSETLRGLCFEGRVIRRDDHHLAVECEGQAILWLHFSHGRLQAQGDLGESYSSSSTPSRYHTVSIGADRDPRKAALDLSRRLFTPFLALWRGERQKRQERRDGIARSRAMLKELSGKLGYDGKCLEEDSDRFRVFHNNKIRGEGGSSVSIDVQVSTGSYGVSLDFKYLSYEQARRLVAALEEPG